MPIITNQKPYRIPSALRDLVLVDMLELTGSTVAAARLLNMSQPSVSRRYRRIATELGLQRSSSDRPGRRYGNADWMRLLRQGVNRHRIDSGVLRLGGPATAEALISHWGWTEWIGLPAGTLAHADELLQEELLDGLVLDAEHCHRYSVNQLIPLTHAQAEPMWLYCRPDPLVQAAAERLARVAGSS
jgi:hypothetical protein